MVQISIGDVTGKAMKCLGIETHPFSSEELVYNFRKLIKICHPDIPSGSKDNDKTAKVIAAYRHLKSLAISSAVGEGLCKIKLNPFNPVIAKGSVLSVFV